MLQILQRLHAQDAEQAMPLGSPRSDAGEEDEEGDIDGLSRETLEKLRLQVGNICLLYVCVCGVGGYDSCVCAYLHVPLCVSLRGRWLCVRAHVCVGGRMFR